MNNLSIDGTEDDNQPVDDEDQWQLYASSGYGNSIFLSEDFDDESRMTMLEKFHTSFDKCQTFHGLKPVCQDKIIQTSWDHLRNYLKTEDLENCGKGSMDHF